MGRKSNFSEAQILAAVREVEGGATATEVARRTGVSLQTLARWRARYAGMTLAEADARAAASPAVDREWLARRIAIRTFPGAVCARP